MKASMRPMPPPPGDPVALRQNTGAVMAIEDLGVSYGAHHALRGVTMDVPPAAITALIGPSGCGKTSLLNALNRLTDLIPGCRVRGRIELGGISIHAPGTEVLQLRRRVGMVFQRPNPFPFSILHNLDLPLREHGVRAASERRDRAEQALREVGLWPEVRDRLQTPALSLSGGQRQRLCIARAIVLQPEVLLMDEPCSALDPQASATVEDLIQSWRRRYTVVLVTHNLAQARRVADHVAMFWTREGSGELIEHGSVENIFGRPGHPLTAAYVEGRQG